MTRVVPRHQASRRSFARPWRYGEPSGTAPRGVGICARPSRVLEIDPTTLSVVWSYTAGSQFFRTNISGMQRLPNGNTLITEGAGGRLFEVTSDRQIVWEFMNAPPARPTCWSPRVVEAVDFDLEGQQLRSIELDGEQIVDRGRELRPRQLVHNGNDGFIRPRFLVSACASLRPREEPGGVQAPRFGDGGCVTSVPRTRAHYAAPGRCCSRLALDLASQQADHTAFRTRGDAAHCLPSLARNSSMFRR